MSYLHYLCLLAYSGVQHILTIWARWRVFYKRPELITRRERIGSPLVFGGVCLARFLVFCVVFFALFVFVLCLVYPMLPDSLGCPFLIAP